MADLNKRLDALTWLRDKLKKKLEEDPEFNDEQYVVEVEKALKKTERKLKLNEIESRK